MKRSHQACSWNREAGQKPTRREDIPAEISQDQIQHTITGIIDHKVALLAVAAAAAKADCDPCLDEIASELEGAGVSKADVREAVKSGRFSGAYPKLAADVFEQVCEDEREDIRARP